MRFLVLVCLVTACSTFGHETPSTGVASLDEAAFQCNVEPILIRDCSYVACHGEANFPFRLYSVGKLRAFPATDQMTRTMPLTPDEHHANFLSASAFAWNGVAPLDNLLVRKPLPASEGGYEHKGNAIWAGGDDPRVTKIVTWLSGGSTCAP